MKLSIINFILCSVILFNGCGKEPAPNKGNEATEQELTTIRDEFDKRVADIFNAERIKPLVKAAIQAPLNPGRAEFVRNYIGSLAGYAARCLWLNENIDAANAVLVEDMDYFLSHPEAIYDRDNFHWHSEVLLRLIEMFGTNGSKHAGLLKPETETKIMEVTWLYCKRVIDEERYHAYALADHVLSDTWYIYESENHHVQIFTTLWHFAKLAKDRPDYRDRLYNDGRTAAVHYHDWNEYVKLYFKERAKKGLLIEMMCIGYNTVLMKGVFNFYDFAEDSELKRRAGLYLDLYFTYWGEEQINGISGGAKSRMYTDTAPRQSDLGYLFFGIGNPSRFGSGLFSAMTTTYRPPLVVVDIACDVTGRGNYEVIQRPLGLAEKGYNNPPVYRMRTDEGGIVRYSYCTPDFVMGTAMYQARPAEDWTQINSQNRSHGVLFAGNDRAWILPECEISSGSKAAFNTQWSVQKKGTMICQKLKYSKLADKMRIWFALEGLTAPAKDNDWIFVEAEGAYAAVRVVNGSSYWQNSTNDVKGSWLYCEDEYSPIIIEVAQKSAYKSFETFKNKVESCPLSFSNNVLRYTGIYGDSFTFYADYSKVPEINQVPVSYAPPKVFDSPFLQSDWNSGIVYIQKGNRKLVLDFNSPN
ncbi:MAG: hypothetical protein AB2L24_26050 [Mangrovibacterium sp.]